MDHLPRALLERKTTWMACLWLNGRAVLRFLARRSPPWSRGSLGRNEACFTLESNSRSSLGRQVENRNFSEVIVGRWYFIVFCVGGSSLNATRSLESNGMAEAEVDRLSVPS
ncbi:MAG: hypothetical protein A2603_08235 [Bdellovibrionales bacterium RIFOXYD1_FULL_55_31]|nr:MAG: hypothetical protein A2603_08235 [Bdellovibrionales bacterium RIFOXYD1_FULL_55_31]